jgi:rare lipoprotein A
MQAAVPPTRLVEALAPPGIVALDPHTTAPLLGQLAGQGSTDSTKAALDVRREALNVLDGHPAIVAGTLRPALAGRVVALQVALPRGWRSVAWTRTGPLGGFRLRYTPHAIGSERVRLRFAGDVHDMPAHRPLGRLNVFRQVGASWYGGGGSLACGGWLTGATLGVANKTLPCGTLVTLRYGAHAVRVPVVDRGPYVAGREFDLTEATKRALGFGGTGDVWSTA